MSKQTALGGSQPGLKEKFNTQLALKSTNIENSAPYFESRTTELSILGFKLTSKNVQRWYASKTWLKPTSEKI